jgi:hypothetical protein
MRKRLTILALLLIVFVGALPMLSTMAALAIVNVLGCRLDEGSVHSCMVWGRDIGETLYTMLVGGWLAMITIPVAVLVLFVWVVGMVVLSAVRRRRGG